MEPFDPYRVFFAVRGQRAFDFYGFEVCERKLGEKQEVSDNELVATFRFRCFVS